MRSRCGLVVDCKWKYVVRNQLKQTNDHIMNVIVRSDQGSWLNMESWSVSMNGYRCICDNRYTLSSSLACMYIACIYIYI